MWNIVPMRGVAEVAKVADSGFDRQPSGFDVGLLAFRFRN
jgi:hypothetical protein